MPHDRTRLAAAALTVAGVLFLLYPALRPWADETTVDGAVHSMSSPWWVATHLFAMIGFILVPLALLPVNHIAAVIMWIGAGLTLPYYGAEDFALNTIATKVADGQQLDLLGLAEHIRYHPAAITTFLIGLILLGVGAVMAAVAIWRSRALPRFSGVLFGAGFALFIPQFFIGEAGRIAHGVLMMAGCLWLAVSLFRTPSRSALDRLHPDGRLDHPAGIAPTEWAAMPRTRR
ncbi:hypothetical protein KZZ52_44430 [Dactylosporangium sp. AC04546]|uniref:hypothetical protein n=1 Tax=Dactylosporangium sp. AC04546 TaxID=2862460 RepID=UPI001EDCE26A|nr:hypothetical protein [Dactylosporangium sp. AC04546]WVK80964.1 hypothetical protein KZZ52_44430 [Dactylosporangium sp. AC04546]